MHILLATGMGPGIHEYGNMGDVSMLQVAVSRLKEQWSDARIHVVTGSPAGLASYCPGCEAVPARGRNLWVGDELLLGPLGRVLPRTIYSLSVAIKRSLGFHSPRLLRFLLHLRLLAQTRRQEIADIDSFADVLSRTDLIVVSGAGGFFDQCRRWNMETLDIIEAGIWRKIPVAMLGQGLGPLSDPVVVARAKRIFPALRLLTLRGSRGGSELAASLGVRPSHIQITGDEAIELAYARRAKEPGNALGINFRIAATAETDRSSVTPIRTIIHRFARNHQAPLVPLPISFNPYADDARSIREILAGYDNESDGGATLDSPQAVIRETARCRVVVTGAYHAAVFALAQGIPVVALSNSKYFSTKFEGLKDQFGNGCSVLSAKEIDFSSKLEAAVETAWESAEKVRRPLEQAALLQIDASRRSYVQLREALS